MNLTSISYALNVVTAHKDSCLATKLHLVHQLGLPEEHRIAEFSTAEMEEQIGALSAEIYKADCCIEELQKLIP